VNGRLLGFGSHITTCSSHKQWVGFTVAVLQVKSLEEDDGCRDHSLANVELLAELADGCIAVHFTSAYVFIQSKTVVGRRLTIGEEDTAILEELPSIDILSVQCSSLVKRRAVDCPSLAALCSNQTPVIK
jgi:hypothetical protein